MLACTETVTLVKHYKEDADRYVCYVLKQASWFAKTVIVTSGEGAKPANTFDVRIFGVVPTIPAPGDYVVKGTVEDVTKPADLKGREYFRITSVGDNRRGMLPHWRVAGA